MPLTHLGKSNFPQPSDMNKKYVESVHPSVLLELSGYVQLHVEHTLNAHTHIEKMHAAHVVSIAEMVRDRIKSINEG